MELLFVAIMPGWNFTTNGRLALPANFPRRLRWRLTLVVAMCDLYSLLTQGRPLRILPLKRREKLVQRLATHAWPWLRGGLALARATALLAAQPGNQPNHEPPLTARRGA